MKRLIDAALWVTWLVAVLTCFVAFCALVEPDAPIVSRMGHRRSSQPKGGQAPARGTREWWDEYWADKDAIQAKARALHKPVS